MNVNLHADRKHKKFDVNKIKSDKIDFQQGISPKIERTFIIINEQFIKNI